jgi:hypothetical protein
MKLTMPPVVLTALLLGLAMTGFSEAMAESPVFMARTITVALDGSGDFSSIQEAVDNAMKGDTVWIRPGRTLRT